MMRTSHYVDMEIFNGPGFEYLFFEDDESLM